MLIILSVALVIASVLLILRVKSKESILLLGLCISLMLELGGIMIFIAKKGGISSEVINFFYFSKAIQIKIRFFLITLGKLGYIVAIGRILFPLFLLEIAMDYSMLKIFRTNHLWNRIALIIPAIMLVLYFPSVYKDLVRRTPYMQRGLAIFSIVWIGIYLLLAVGILLTEYFSITMNFCRRQFSQIVVFLIAITSIYLLYFLQDPGQVYNFYSSVGTWYSGWGYLQLNPSILSYSILVAVNVIGAIIGFFGFFHFTREEYEDNRESIVLKSKFDVVKIGVSTFVHSMKNQLLSSRIIYKRIDQLFENETLDVEKLKEHIESLKAVNEGMLNRIEELYCSVKSNAIVMTPVTISELFEVAVERFHTKYPEEIVQIEIEEDYTVLADKYHFCEALYNLLINAEESVQSAEREEKLLRLRCNNERLYTVIQIKDNGMGIPSSELKKVFDPFYSSKNSNYNWGMGLYYVREIVKSHLGSIKVESKPGVGTSFYILLPRYK